MRVTVCELPHETSALTAAWAALCEHTVAHVSQLVLLPEFAMVEPVWESEHFDPARWSAIETLNAMHLRRLADLRAEYVVGTRPVTLGGRRSNQGYLWSVADGVQPLVRLIMWPTKFAFSPMKVPAARTFLRAGL